MVIPLPYFVKSVVSVEQCIYFTVGVDGLALHVKFSFPGDQRSRIKMSGERTLINKLCTFGFSKSCFAYSNKQCLSCRWQLNYFSQERFDKWFSTFWFLRILTTPQKHELILYVTCLIYLRCMYYVAKAIRRELKDRVIHSIFMITGFFTMSLPEKKCSEIQSMQSSQTFVASPSGLWFREIVGVIFPWLHREIHRIEPILTAGSPSSLPGFCRLCVVPKLLAVWQ